MLNENAKALVAALRSGEYKQTQGRLASKDANGNWGHCCLGVACVLAAKAGVLDVPPIEHSTPEFNSSKAYKTFDGEAHYLPPTVQKWLGFRSVKGSYSTSSLAVKNDTGASFAQIAAIIESEPDGLFGPPISSSISI